MDYGKIYEMFIKDRVGKQKITASYTERHHIVPRSLGGGNEPENIVILTARDHFFAHLLLAKIHGGPMLIALWRMSHKKSQGSKFRVVTSRQFNKIRMDYAQEMSKRFSGVPRPLWVRKKISESLKGRVIDKKWRENMSKSRTGKKLPPMSEERKRAIAERMTGDKNHRFGKPLSKKQIEAIRKANSGKNSSSHNRSIFKFIHKNGTIEECTQLDLREKYKIKNHGNLSMVCSGKRRSCEGWMIKDE